VPANGFRLIARALVLCLAGACAVGAQPPSTAPASDNPPAAAGRSEPGRNEAGRNEAGRNEAVQEVKPDVFYLKDKEGQLQPVLGFTLEDFERMLAVGAAKGVGQARPSYRIDRVTAKGKSQGDRAELSVSFQIFVDDKDWVRIPLRLGGCVVRGEARYEGPGEHLFQYDDRGSEYVVWLRGAGEKPHQLTLDVLAPLTTLAGETRLKLSVPRAFNSELLLSVPGDHAVGQVSAGAVLDAATSKGAETQFKVLGLTSDFSLSWRQGEGPVPEVPAVLEATGGLITRIDGRSLNTQAELTVRSFGGEFESFRVRLPPGAILLGSDSAEYTIHPVSEPTTARSEVRGRAIEVRLRNRTAGPVHVKLVTEQTYEMNDQKQWLQLGGFEVLGAVRQWGHLALQVVGDWQVVWSKASQIRQVEDLPPELWRDNMLAGFEYFAQPFSLQAQVNPRLTRVNVEPEYVALIGATRVEIEARLKYRIAGAKAFSFDVDLAGWRLDDVGPLSRINPAELVAENLTPLTIPLQEAASGDLELIVRAHRDLPAGAHRVDFTLPQPRGATVGAATVVVLPADNVDLKPLESGSVGLVRQYAKPAGKLPVRQQPPLVYQCDGGEARFVADFHVATRTLAVAVASHVQLGLEGGQIKQQLTYQVGREAVDDVALLVPEEVAEAGKLSIAVGGQPLTWQPIESDTVDDGKPDLVRVSLPRPALGRLVLELAYPWTHEKPLPSTSSDLHVPLVMPADGDLATNDLTVSADDAVRFQLLDTLWQEQAGPRRGRQQASHLQLSSPAARSELLLALHLAEAPRLDSIIVDRAWIQTWLSLDVRRDRAVYRLKTARPELLLKLPGGAILTEALVDGEKTRAREGSGADELIIPLGHKADTPLTVEVLYHFPEHKQRPVEGRLDLHAPTLDKTAWIERQYWQVLVPREEILVDHGPLFTDENQWSWRGGYWARDPLMDQFQLESWCAARHETPISATARHYLFGTVGAQRTLQLTAMRLAYLVLVGSGGALALGLLLLYVPVLRHPLVWLLLGCALAAGAGMWPQPAMIAAQSAALGLLLVALAALLKRISWRRRLPAPLPRKSASSILDRGSTQTQLHMRPPSAAGHTSTTTAQVAQASASESQS
jgi:hypothetical protein